MNPSTLSQLSTDMAALIDAVRPALVEVRPGRHGHGAGVIYRPDGLVVTNAHVVGRARQLELQLADGRIFQGRVTVLDRKRDLAAVQIEDETARNLPTIPVGQRNTIRPGQFVLAIGHPWGVTGAVTAGAVIGLGPSPEMPAALGEFLHVGLHMRPGHSGGPMIDAQGRLIGINTMIAGPDVGMAVPIDAVTRFLAQIDTPAPEQSPASPFI